MKLDAKQLRVSEPTEAQLKKIRRRPIYIVCDNILDTYNIGSIFRLADAVAASKIYLCGETETPPNTKIARASVGTDKWVPWEHVGSAVDAIKELRKFYSVIARSYSTTLGTTKQSKKKIATPLDSLGARNDNRALKVIAIEQHKKAVDYRKVNFRQPVALVIGHETRGVSEEVLNLVDEIVEIPMYGVNVSLNVMVSLAIILYRAV